MNRPLLYCLIGMMAVNGIVAPVSLAEGRGEKEHIPFDKMLEFSLERLEDTIQKSVQNNERLSFENAMLKKSIGELGAVKDSLISSKAGLTGKADELSFREMRPSSVIVDTVGRQKRTQELIVGFQKDIELNEEKIRFLDKRLDAEGFRKYKKQLEDNMTRSEKDLAKAEQRLTELRDSNAKIVGEIEALVRTQQGLISKIEHLRVRRRGF